MGDKINTERPGYHLLLTNSIAAHFDSKFVDLALTYFCMSSSHVVVASYSAFYVWQFKNFKEFAMLERGVKKKGGLEKSVGFWVGWVLRVVARKGLRKGLV